MRYSFLALLGSGLITIAAGCADTDDASVPPGTSSKGGTSGKGGTAGKGGTSGKGGTAGKGGTSGNNSTAGKGGTSGKGGSGATGGATAGKGGKGSVGGTGATSTGGTGVDAGASGTDPGAGANGLAGASNAGGDAGTAGTDAGGAGGEAGSVGDPCPGGVQCGAECIDPEVRTVDQLQLVVNGTISLSKGQRPGQSFTVGTPGLLAGVEIAIGACNGADPTGQIQLELYDEQATSLGHVTLDAAPLRTDCGTTDLVEEAIGLGYFDLTPLCLSVEPDTKLTFVLSLVGGNPATCDMQTYECSNNGHFCYSDDGCGGDYNVGFTNCGGTGCETTGYAGGEAVTQDVSSGALNPLPAFEVEFKTFVQ